MSTRKLHATYQGADLTYAQTVLAMRVTGCARDLAADDRSSLSDLAARRGFSDLSHMNRVFRAHRGCLPSEYRAGRAGRAEGRRGPSP
ncbi:helix-turn-helix domain-containing protein [Pseudonocardia oroxyli]|uniref:Helix-turn-helix domain-containing protein n=1 Tax=Pseudonocardia oroxyli TaxID=366584 RepID=A0A1G7UT63_PSEOR|nr:helix-turn-helix domain-containing protein [Pseudonocardia oroxyli]SDG50722.1 Helix-turn-helix domain-containing protein [Pseudonocardia oroxyli]